MKWIIFFIIEFYFKCIELWHENVFFYFLSYWDMACFIQLMDFTRFMFNLHCSELVS